MGIYSFVWREIIATRANKGDALEPEDSNGDAMQKCPSCGFVVSPEINVCPSCGTNLFEELDLDMVEVEDESLENNMIDDKKKNKKKDSDDDVSITSVREKNTSQKYGRTLSEKRTPPTMSESDVKEKAKESPMERRAKFMQRGTITLVALGIFDLIVSIIKMRILYFWLGVIVGNLIVILYVLGRAYSLYSAASREMSSYESKQISRVFFGLLIMLTVPIHETYNIFPMGYYSPPWGMVNMFLLLIGAVYCTVGILFSREKIGYFGVWMAGVSLLLISPPTHFVSLFYNLLNVGWFHETIAVMSGTIIVVSFALKNYRDAQYREYEDKMKRGHELFTVGRYEDAMMNYDRCIVLAHTLYGHRCYNPDVPISRMKVPPEYVSPWISKGRVLIKLGNYRKACAIFNLILEIEPSNPYALMDKARCLMEMGEMDDALSTINRAAAISPNNPDIAALREKIFETVKGMEEIEEEETEIEEMEEEEVEELEEI